MLKHRLIVFVVLSVMVSGCAAGRAFRKGQEAERVGDFDTAVAEFTRAVQEDPTRAEFRISLERATQNASREHIVKAHELELTDQLDGALLQVQARGRARRDESSRRVEGRRARKDDPRPHRGVASAPGHREDARGRARAGDAAC